MIAKWIGVAVLALVAAASAADELYRWVDADGQVHFGDHPPPQGKAENIEGQLHPINSADAPTVAKVAHSGQQTTVEQQYEQRKQAQAQQQRQRLQSACRRAQRSLRIMQGPVTFVDDNGNEVKMTERQRQQKAAELQGEIRRVCG